jgi:protease YdgD
VKTCRSPDQEIPPLCKLLGRTAYSTGFLIGPCHVLTAAHCLFSILDLRDCCCPPHPVGASTVRVYPGYGHRSPAPVIEALRWRVSLNWAISGAGLWAACTRPKCTEEDAPSESDYGLITLKCPVPCPSPNTQAPWIINPGPTGDTLPNGLCVTTGGYARHCCFPAARGQACGSRQDYRDGPVESQGKIVSLGLESSSGHSGSPVWTMDTRGRASLRGIAISATYVSEDPSGVTGMPTQALRMRPDVLAEIAGWIREDVATGICPTQVLPRFL